MTSGSNSHMKNKKHLLRPLHTGCNFFHGINCTPITFFELLINHELLNRMPISRCVKTTLLFFTSRLIFLSFHTVNKRQQPIAILVWNRCHIHPLQQLQQWLNLYLNHNTICKHLCGFLTSCGEVASTCPSLYAPCRFSVRPQQQEAGSSALVKSAVRSVATGVNSFDPKYLHPNNLHFRYAPGVWRPSLGRNLR